MISRTCLVINGGIPIIDSSSRDYLKTVIQTGMFAIDTTCGQTGCCTTAPTCPCFVSPPHLHSPSTLASRRRSPHTNGTVVIQHLIRRCVATLPSSPRCPATAATMWPPWRSTTTANVIMGAGEDGGKSLRCLDPSFSCAQSVSPLLSQSQ